MKGRGLRDGRPLDSGGVSLPTADQTHAAQDFAYQAPKPNYTKIPLDDARDDELIEIGASNFIYVRRASSPSAVLYVKFNSQEGRPWPVNEGAALAGFRFQKLYLTNDAQAGAWLELMTGVAGRNLQIVNPGDVVSTVTESKSTTIGEIPNVTVAGVAVKIADADATRRELIIRNLGTGSAVIGGSTVTAARGYYLADGASVVIATTAEVWAIRGGGTNPTLTMCYTGD